MALRPAYWKEAQRELAAADPVMGGIIRAYKGETLVSRGDPFYSLARSIIGQQISVKAADTIWGRFETLAGSMEPQKVRKLKAEDLRACGLSKQKIAYLTDLSEKFLSEHVDWKLLESMDDEEVIKTLTSIKGIGRWTAEMFLIFCLMRQDVFPIADIGLQKAMKKHYRHNATTSMQRHANKQWRPWRTVATWYLWRSLDPVPVEY